MFSTSRPVLLFDYFRVPYAVESQRPDDRLAQAQANGRTLLWSQSPGGQSGGIHWLGESAIFGDVVSDDEADSLLTGRWERVATLVDGAGSVTASVRRSDRGDVFLPFDPDVTMRACWSESYTALKAQSRAKALAMAVYYRVRPFLPRQVQIALRRAFLRVQLRSTFPRWPAETGLHDLYDLLLGLAAEVAGRPVPWIWHWPRGREWALVLTHDVETSHGYDHIDVLRDVETSLGFRSSWNFVPRRYEVADDVVRSLWDAGFEVGVHGLYHDGRDLESAGTLEQRLPEIRRWAERWRAVGFRSPATHRDWDLMPLLGFEYDSSYPDTDPIEPKSGGCCTWLPFFNDGLVELPITLVQDHTLFVILQRDDEQAWRAKSEVVRRRGGMALLITHPDYMLSAARVDAYRRFLESYADDPTLWTTLPCEVNAWWRRRAESSIERTGRTWRIVGPAADEGRVELAQAAYL